MFVYTQIQYEKSGKKTDQCKKNVQGIRYVKKAAKNAQDCSCICLLRFYENRAYPDTLVPHGMTGDSDA
jgi:hypothetical protein